MKMMVVITIVNDDRSHKDDGSYDDGDSTDDYNDDNYDSDDDDCTEVHYTTIGGKMSVLGVLGP